MVIIGICLTFNWLALKKFILEDLETPEPKIKSDGGHKYETINRTE